MLHTLMQEALYSARWCRLRSLFRVTCRKCLLACSMNRAQLLLRSLKVRLRAMLGMVRVQRWSYLQRPRPWLEFHHCFDASGAVSSSAGRARMARYRQVPRRSESLSVWPARSYYAKLHGAFPSGIRWGAGAIFCSCLLYTSPSPRDATLSRMPSSA